MLEKKIERGIITRRSAFAQKVREPFRIYGLPNFSATDLHCERYLSRSCLSWKWFPRRLTPDGNFSKASTGKSNGMHSCNVPHPDPLFVALGALCFPSFLSTHQRRAFACYCDPVSFHSSRFTRTKSSHILTRLRDESQGCIADTWNITLSSLSCERVQGQRINLYLPKWNPMRVCRALVLKRA